MAIIPKEILEKISRKILELSDDEFKALLLKYRDSKYSKIIKHFSYIKKS